MWRLVFLFLITPASAQTAGDLYAALAGSAAVRAECPQIVSTDMSDPDDRGTWSAEFASAPNETCQGIVQGVIDNFQMRPAIPTTMQIASTGAPSVNGTYATDAVTQGQIAGINLYLLINNTFPGGASSQVWPDTTGTLHTFDRTNWLAFSKAMADFMFAEGSGISVSQPIQIP